MSTIQGRYAASADLLRRARTVIPGGVWGHNRMPSALDPDELPWFADSGRGARIRDVDGNWYVDYICGYGAMINGYARPEIDAAVHAQSARGSTLSQATARSVELAELLVDLVAGMTWVTWGTSGSDATWTALTMARAYTGRPHVAQVAGAYHGSHAWSGPADPGQGRPGQDSALVHQVPWNDVAALDALFAGHGDRLAAFMVTPYHHPIPGDAEFATPEWRDALNAHCRRTGTQLVVDDVRAGFRLDLRGSHVAFGFQADLVCFSKGLGNGWPLSAVLGTEALRATSDDIFLAGTFWNSANSMAAAVANLTLLRDEYGVKNMRHSGELLAKGLRGITERHGVPLRVTGPAAMPSVTVRGDDQQEWMRRFAVHMAAQGTLLHPGHNWALSTAHSPEIVEETLTHAETAVARAQEDLGR
jgi:glutamate-1-semialdehyde 2,1-aminomutase